MISPSRYETVAWIPNGIAFITMLGTGGKQLGSYIPPVEPASTASVLSFATTIVANDMSWCIITPDYGVYHSSKASRLVATVMLAFQLSQCISVIQFPYVLV